MKYFNVTVSKAEEVLSYIYISESFNKIEINMMDLFTKSILSKYVTDIVYFVQHHYLEGTN